MNRFARWLMVTVLLFVVWILLSGILKTKFIIFGMCSAAVISYLCIPSMFITGRDGKSKYFLLDVNLWRFTKYFLWLFLEIVKSSLHVSKSIIKPHIDIEPLVVEFDWHYDNPIAATTLVNSIILTPGTLTADVYDEVHFVVHALDKKSAEILLTGEMQRRISYVFKEEMKGGM